MAVGNVGEFLDTVADEVCTWLSNDGGLTWHDIAPGNHIYEFGDSGDLFISLAVHTYAVVQPYRGTAPPHSLWRMASSIEAHEI